jgi:hypothetical protein
MKKKERSKSRDSGFPRRAVWCRCLVGALLLVFGMQLRAAETNAPAVNTETKAAETNTPALEPEKKPAETNAPAPLKPEEQFEGGNKAYNNWIEFSTGGFFTEGSRGPAEKREQLNRGVFGGIEDLHYQKDITNGTTLTIDGRSIFDNHDYKLQIGITREKLGYMRLGVENFRTWDSDTGGSFIPDGLHYSLRGDGLALDRGSFSFEAGLLKDKYPKLIFKYTHWWRDGEKSSTSWGPVPTSFGTRALYPGFYDIDEHSDSFQLDGSYNIKKIKTDVALGVRYETGTLDDARKLTFLSNPLSPARVTDRQRSTYDFLNVHASTETWIKKDLFLSTGFMYANLDNDFTGNRIYGDDFDVPYSPMPQLGYLDLNGGAHKNEYVANVNVQATPFKNFVIVPSLRMQKEDWNSDSSGIATRDGDTGSFTGNSDRDLIDVRERLDARYIGFTNWVLWTSGEWAEAEGNLKEFGGLGQVNGIGIAPIARETDDNRWFQKYSLGARWYPSKLASIDVGGYYKLNRYDYDHALDSTPNDLSTSDAYPAFLVFQDFETYDGNVRLTLRPCNKVTLVSRYEYQISTIHTRPDSVSGLSEVESSDMNRHLFGQNASWTPLNWLSLQAGFNYVSSVTKTPASGFTQAILNSQNNYWTLNFNTGFVLDNKTDLNIGYYYYRADDYQNNSAFGLPLGAGAEEHSIAARLTRRITQNIRWNLKYAFTHYSDTPSAGAFNYNAHVIFTSLQYRF